MTRLTIEGDGLVIACDCLWLRWFPTKSAALDAGRAHAEKCKASGILGHTGPGRLHPLGPVSAFSSTGPTDHMPPRADIARREYEESS